MHDFSTPYSPRLGETVHYVSYGTPGGEFDSTCRVAIVVGAGNHETPLCVLNPTGLFFNAVPHDEHGRTPGSWHFSHH